MAAEQERLGLSQALIGHPSELADDGQLGARRVLHSETPEFEGQTGSFWACTSSLISVPRVAAFGLTARVIQAQ